MTSKSRSTLASAGASLASSVFFAFSYAYAQAKAQAMDLRSRPLVPCRETLSSLAEGRKKNKTREVQARYRRCLG